MRDIANTLEKNSTNPYAGGSPPDTVKTPSNTDMGAQQNQTNVNVGTSTVGKRADPSSIATASKEGMLTLSGSPPDVTQKSNVMGLFIAKKEEEHIKENLT